MTNYSPESNGGALFQNRTVLEVAQSMKTAWKCPLPDEILVEALNKVNHTGERLVYEFSSEEQTLMSKLGNTLIEIISKVRWATFNHDL